MGRAAEVKILFRADASIALGTGHVMRCLALADALKARGADCTFICTASKGDLLDLIEARGHCGRALRPPQGAQPAVDWTVDAELSRTHAREIGPDWLVVDHYRLGAEWERSLRPSVGKILAIDDIGRAHSCDALLDQTGAADGFVIKVRRDYQRFHQRSPTGNRPRCAWCPRAWC